MKKKFLEEGSSYIYIYIDFILRTGRERETEREIYDIAESRLQLERERENAMVRDDLDGFRGYVRYIRCR